HSRGQRFDPAYLHQQKSLETLVSRLFCIQAAALPAPRHRQERQADTMRKDILSRALELTRECLERYWQGDAEYVLSWCAEDILWVASAQSQYLKGIQAVQEDCRAVIPALQRCHLLAQE